VFLCGLVTYELIADLSPGGRWQRVGRSAALLSPVTAGLSSVAFALLAIVPWPRLPQPGSAFLPSHVIAAVTFSATIVAVALRCCPLIENHLVVRLGQASFSAYLLHFAVITGYEALLPNSVISQTGVSAVVASVMLFLLVLVTTGLVAQITYRFIEAPAIRLGTLAIRRAALTA
jgi:peptidoglycan/LPS O-acetylase OafA/YrhL